MKTLKDFAHMSTDLFVRFNEEVAERMKDLKVDDKFTNELLGTVHHVKDKNDFYMEIADFWSNVYSDIKNDSDLKSDKDFMEALRSLQAETKKIYSRKSTAKESKTADFFAGAERFSEEIASRMLEMGMQSDGKRKKVFDALVDFSEKFQELDAGKNSADYEKYNELWNEFQENVLGNDK